MTRVLLNRLAFSLAAILLITFVVTLFTDLMPGDPAEIIAGENPTPDIVERIREETGLDEPIVERYVGFWGDVLTGDLGTSVGSRSGTPVSTLLGETLPVTLALGLAAFAIALMLGVPLGYVSALRPGSILDRLMSSFAAAIMAFPTYVLGLVLLTLFAVSRPWFPAVGYVAFTEDPVEWLRHIALPAFTLGAVAAAETARQARAAFIDVFERDFIRAADAKGIGRLRVHGRHLLKNAMAPIATILGINAIRFLGGAVVVEQIFVIPGVGTLAYDAVSRRDVPLLQGIVLISAIGVVVINFLVDIVAASVDPRVRRS